MKKIIIYVFCILLFLSFTIIIFGCGEDLNGNSGNSGPCPKNRTCYAKWVDPYHYSASGCGRSSCAVTKAGEKQITASCSCQ